MSTSTVVKTTPILSIGLPPTHALIRSHPDVISGKTTPETVKRDIQKMSQDLENSPYEHEILFIGPEDGVASLEAKLKEKQWKGIVVGYGVRAHPEATAYFEDIINCCHVHAPQAKFSFNISPATTLEALQRNVPA